MTEIIRDPVATLNKKTPWVTRRFAFKRPTEIIDRSATDEMAPNTMGQDLDINSGLVVNTHGFYRLARHKPTGALCLFAAKRSSDLRGVRQSDNTIRGEAKGLGNAYIIAAYRSTGDNSDIYRHADDMRAEIRRHGEELGRRSQRDFTLFSARLSELDPGSRHYNADTLTEMYTNGRLAYLIDGKKHDYEVRFYAPTRLRDGQLVPVSLGQHSLVGKFAYVSKRVALTSSYEDARAALARHWQGVSSRLWDERSIYRNEGVGLNLKRAFSAAADYVTEYKIAAISTLIVGSGLSVVKPAAGIGTGIAIAAAHTAAHTLSDEGISASINTYQRARKARQRQQIEAYNYGENATDHFSIQTADYIGRQSPKLDLERFDANEFEFLEAHRCGLLRDHESAIDGFQPDSLRGHLISAHQRGFTTQCMLLDKHTRLDIFQSGMVRLMHEMTDGNVLIYTRDRPDACLSAQLRMPDDTQQRFGQDIQRIIYEPRRSDFRNAFNGHSGTVTQAAVVEDMQARLFRDQPNLSEAVKRRSRDAIHYAFAEPDRRQRPDYMNNKPPALPDIKAVM